MSLQTHSQPESVAQKSDVEALKSPDKAAAERPRDKETSGVCYQPDLSRWPMKGLNFVLSKQEKECLVLLPAATVGLAILLTAAFMIAYGSRYVM